jgi:Predicted Zn-dependent protease (DUF2268)
MNPVRLAVILAALACLAAAPAGPDIHIEDVTRFYAVYDAAGGHPSAERIQHDYVDPGTDGLHQFFAARNTTAVRIADAIATRPQIYSDARRCMAVLPRVRRRLELSMHKLGELYPEAVFPAVTIAVGRGRPVGISGPGMGVQIGLEALCATRYLNPDVEERFVHVIAHEYVHAQQAPALADNEHPTVLERSLIEGAAEFVGELTSGQVAYSVFGASTRGRELAIETAFAADQDKTDLSAWLDNGTATEPGDLGYWVGYRICKAYYQHAPDKRRAIREIIQMTDAKAFLARSGWRPGIELK